MNVEHAWVCTTNESFGPITVSKYQVRWGRNPGWADSTFGPHCTCPGFKFRKSCKHIAEMEKQRCGWNGTLEPTLDCSRDASGNRCCPECGEPVAGYRVLV